MTRNIFAAALVFTITLSVEAFGAVSPISVAILPPVQFPPEDFSVTGPRLSVLWGSHRDVYGLDIGLIGNITKQDFVGVAASGVFNATMGNTTILGLQLAGITNYNKNNTSVFGVQAALGANYNASASSVVGLQLAAANLSEHTKIYGLQVGLYNRADEVYGFQIGVINVAASLHGLQIGLMNFHKKGLFPVCPVINMGF